MVRSPPSRRAAVGAATPHRLDDAPPRPRPTHRRAMDDPGLARPRTTHHRHRHENPRHWHRRCCACGRRAGDRSPAVEPAIAARPTITGRSSRPRTRLPQPGRQSERVDRGRRDREGVRARRRTGSLASRRSPCPRRTARAGSELRSGAGFGAQTITSLIGQLDDGKTLKAGDVLVIDEAGMVGTRQLSRSSPTPPRSTPKSCSSATHANSPRSKPVACSADSPVTSPSSR